MPDPEDRMVCQWTTWLRFMEYIFIGLAPPLPLHMIWQIDDRQHTTSFSEVYASKTRDPFRLHFTSLSLSLTLFLSFSFSSSLSFNLFLCISLHIYLSVCLSLCVYLLLSLSISLCLSIFVSLFCQYIMFICLSVSLIVLNCLIFRNICPISIF